MRACTNANWARCTDIFQAVHILLTSSCADVVFLFSSDDLWSSSEQLCSPFSLTLPSTPGTVLHACRERHPSQSSPVEHGTGIQGQRATGKQAQRAQPRPCTHSEPEACKNVTEDPSRSVGSGPRTSVYSHRRSVSTTQPRHPIMIITPWYCTPCQRAMVSSGLAENSGQVIPRRSDDAKLVDILRHATRPRCQWGNV